VANLGFDENKNLRQ